jgi:hypothetical protein
LEECGEGVSGSNVLVIFGFGLGISLLFGVALRIGPIWDGVYALELLAETVCVYFAVDGFFVFCSSEFAQTTCASEGYGHSFIVAVIPGCSRAQGIAFLLFILSGSFLHFNIPFLP